MGVLCRCKGVWGWLASARVYARPVPVLPQPTQLIDATLVGIAVVRQPTHPIS